MSKVAQKRSLFCFFIISILKCWRAQEPRPKVDVALCLKKRSTYLITMWAISSSFKMFANHSDFIVHIVLPMGKQTLFLATCTGASLPVSADLCLVEHVTGTITGPLTSCTGPGCSHSSSSSSLLLLLKNDKEKQ